MATDFWVDQEALNGQTVGNWEFYTTHRSRMTTMIHRAAKKSGPKEQTSLLVLGAGNCNDLDLFTLLSTDAVSKIVLLDLDPRSVRAGVASQWERLLEREGLPASLLCEGESRRTTSDNAEGLASVPSAMDHEEDLLPVGLQSIAPLCALKSRIHVLRSIDISGIAEDLSNFSPSTTLQEVERVKQKATNFNLVQRVKDELNDESFKGFDVVVSDLVMSQIGTFLMTALGDERPDVYLPLLLAVRQKHIESLISLTLPEGHALFVTDVVSSRTLPSLDTISENELMGARGSQFLQELIDQGNFFTGTNVFSIIESLLKNNPNVAETRLVGPWLWFLGHKTHLVCALDIIRPNQSRRRR